MSIVSWWSFQSLDQLMRLDPNTYQVVHGEKLLGSGDRRGWQMPGSVHQSPPFERKNGPQPFHKVSSDHDDRYSSVQQKISEAKRNGQWLEKVRRHQQEIDEVRRPPRWLNGGNTTSRVSHPEFVATLKDAQVRLMSTKIIDSSTVKVVSSWELAPTPTNQSVLFGDFLFPPPCIQPNITTVILVLSSQENFLRREAIRKTWGVKNMVYFVVGHSRNDEDTAADKDHRHLLLEQLTYQDLLEVPMVESYSKLPEKLVQAYRWTILNVPNVRWIVKADDDSFVRPYNLDRYLEKYNPNVPMLIGKIMPHSPTAKRGKWFEHEWKADFYPYWAMGSAGHVVSHSVAQYVSENSGSLHRYQGEDVSLGIWLHQWKQKVTYIQASSMITNEGTVVCGTPRYMMIGHDLTLDDVCDCFLQYQNASVVDENTWVDEAASYADLVKEETGDIRVLL
jgi:Galactosyltransferase